MGHYTLGISTMKTIIFFTFVVISLKLVIANPLDITDRNAIKSKCDDKELKEASDNYEECQQMIFTTMKDMRAKENQGNDVIKKSTNSDEKQILTILEATLSDGDNALCQALDKFINNCTTILGWYFTDEHVQATMKEQREVSRSAWPRWKFIVRKLKTLPSQLQQPVFQPQLLKQNPNYLNCQDLLQVILIMMTMNQNQKLKAQRHLLVILLQYLL